MLWHVLTVMNGSRRPARIQAVHFCAGRPETPYEVYWREKESPSDAAAIKRWRRDNYAHKENGRLRHEKKDKLRNFVNQGTSCNEV